MAFLAPFSRRQFIDANGVPYSGGKIWTYLAGTTTPATTYQDNLSATPNANPIILDSEGRTPYSVWLTDDVTYKYAVLESDDTPIYTEDNVAGMNDFTVPTVNEWIATTFTCTYSSATVFTVSGSDQTSTLHVGRRIKITNAGGTNAVYATITVSSYAASTTTITYVVDSGTVTNAAILVSYSILSSVNPSVPKIALPDGSTAVTQSSSDNTTKIATTAFARSLLVQYTNLRRQTVVSAMVDANGQTALGGSTGGTTIVTTAIGAAPASGATYVSITSMPLVVTAANGYGADVTGRSTSNLTWTGLNSVPAVTYYLYVDVDEASGALTTGSTTVAPTYQNGGSPLTTAATDTFNIEQMVMWCGNGASAVQKYRVYLGQVDASGGVTTANLIWYAVQGFYDSGYTATLPGTASQITKNHYIGVSPLSVKLITKCTTANLNFVVGDEIEPYTSAAAGVSQPFNIARNRKSCTATTGSTVAFAANNYTTGANSSMIAGSWSYKIVADRGW
jgi:hypothetical protein